MITTEIGPSSDADIRRAWNTLVHSRHDSTPFHQLAFLERSAAANGGLVRIILIRADEEVVSGAALAVRQRLGFLTEVFIPPYAPYSALLLPPQRLASAQAAAASSMLLSASLPRFGFARVFLAPGQNVATLPAWKSQKLRTFLIDTHAGGVESIDDITRRWSDNPKRLFRKHHDEYAIEILDAHPEVAVDLNVASYARHGRTLPIPRRHLIGLVSAMVDHGAANIFVARNRSTSEIDASVVLLFDDSTAFYWIAGSKPGPAMTVLIADLLMECRRRGLRTFDFVGANTPGIADFKRRFGPDLIEYTSLIGASPGVLGIALAARRRLMS